jgi:hypothetical protein
VWLQQKLTLGTFGPISGDTLYALYYPKSTTIRLEGDRSCEAFGGYHYETMVDTTKVAYAVMPRCKTNGRESEIDILGIVASHEYFEWVTDPFPLTDPAYQRTDDAHIAWGGAFGGELSDLCTYLDFGQGINVPGIDVQVQRQWSNRASLAGKHPCAPSNGAPYAVAVPETPDTIMIDDSNGTIRARGITVPRGGSKTVRIQFHSDVPASIRPKEISVLDFQTQGEPQGYTISFSSDTIGPGQVVTMTIIAERSAQMVLPVMIFGDLRENPGMWPFLLQAQ